MLNNRDDVLKLRDNVRKRAGNYFIPLGGYDISTEKKKDISNLTGTLYNHLPLVKAIVDASADLPVYVGYDGQEVETRNGTYTENLILLHQPADESTLSFIHAYTHELVHLDQDRRGLLHENDPVPPAREMVNYLAHNMMLEAAAFATEAVSLYFISERSSLSEVDDEVEGYFDEYADTMPPNVFIRETIEEPLEGRRGRDFQSLKPAWQAVFQSFFEPDSAHLANYLKQFTRLYLYKSVNGLTELEQKTPAAEWGSAALLKEITTMTGWGPMFPQAAIPVLLRTIRAAITQEKHLPMIDMARSHVAAREPNMDNILSVLTGPGFNLR